jgi:xylitol oxidase
MMCAMPDSMTLVNWAGSHTYRAAQVHRPSTMEELRTLLARAPRIRVLGTRHTFTAMGDADELVSLAALPAEIVVDRDGGTVTCTGATTYGELAPVLDRHGLALQNLASLPHISVAGAIATATHGSGDAHGNLATAVTALELTTSEGDVVTLRRGDDGFDGAVVHLGALGAVTRVTLATQRAEPVRQRVFEGMAWEALGEHLDALFASGDSVSAFTRWGDVVDQVWVKRRGGDDLVAAELFGARAATVDRHPIIELDAVNCTAQLGRPGPWWDRLPHFRLGFAPSAGEELQSEYFVARADATAAIGAVRALGPELRPLLLVSELRTVAADELWMSPHHRRASLGLHFTWRRDPAGVAAVLPRVEDALAPFGARPHPGKVFAARPPRPERADDFERLAAALDPRGAFRNAWFEEHVAAPG